MNRVLKVRETGEALVRHDLLIVRFAVGSAGSDRRVRFGERATDVAKIGPNARTNAGDRQISD